jgi:HK97 family phage major capsid protein
METPIKPAVITAGQTSTELRQLRKANADQITALIGDDGKRARSEQEDKDLQTLLDNETAYTRAIELALQLEKRNALAAGQTIEKDEKEKREMGKFSLSKLVREVTMAKGDVSKVTGLEAEMLRESEKEAREMGISPSGIYLGNSVIEAVNYRTMTAGTATAGGNFIPTEKVGFFDALYNATVMAELGVQSLTGLSANTDLKGLSAGATATWGGETDSISPNDATTAARELRPNTLASAMDVSRTLAVQTNNSIDAYLLNSMRKSMAVALEAAVINGDGTNKPLGILGTGGIQSVAVGTNGGALTYALLLQLAEKVKTAGANANNLKWLTNFKVEGKMKQTPIDAGSGAMILAYMAYFNGIAGMVDGKPISFTQNVPSNLAKGTSGTVCSALICGDFSNIVMAQFGGIELSIDSTSAAVVRAQKIALTITQLVDSAVLQPAALGAIQDITT